jgi:two-component system, chemotaxis family, protein-glutamate methylesterase/glutaminase
MPKRNIFVIGSSAGGVEALQKLCGGLPADFPGVIVIAQHLSPSTRSVLPDLLARASRLPVRSPDDGEALQMGHIYVGAPDQHILLRPGRILTRRGPHENRSRPAVNALFRSAAIAYGAQVVGIVLTGLLDDGTDGLIAIGAAGGLSIAQDPADAEWPSMPRNAIQKDHVKIVARLDAMPQMLSRVAMEETGPSIPLPQEYLVEDRIAAQEFAVMDSKLTTPGTASNLSCPDCGGVLNQIETEDALRYRCQVGHAFTPLGLAVAQSEELERALGIAVRTHRDRARLFEQMQERAKDRGFHSIVNRWALASEEAAQLAAILEQALDTLRKPQADLEMQTDDGRNIEPEPQI